MKMIIFLILFSYPVFLCAQKSTQELKAEKHFMNYSFEKAITCFENSESLSTSGLRNLAKAYRFTNQYKMAEDKLSKLALATDNVPDDFFRYAEMLKMNGKHLEAEKWMDKFHEFKSDDRRGIEYYNNHGAYEKLKEDQERFIIRNLMINSEQEDFGAVFYKNKVVFASSREGTKSIRRKWNWNHLPFLDIYIGDRESNGELREIALLSKTITKKFHEGPVTFSGDGQYMVFTSDDYDGKSVDGTIKLQLMQTSYNGDFWSKPTAFDFNSHEYSCGHGALSADGETLFFASDMPGGIGGSDLYKVTKGKDGAWGKPINLGNQINTEGNEFFPFIQSRESLLFFASDGHVGLGGLDVFVVKMKEDSSFSKLQNVGVPINSERDDFSLVMDATNQYGYFASNRPGGKGDDDIYSVEMNKPFVFGKTILGVGKDKNGNLLVGVDVALCNAAGDTVQVAVTGEDGSYSFSVEADQSWTLAGSKENYFNGTLQTSSAVNDDVIVANLELEKDPGISLIAVITDSKSSEPVKGVAIKLIDNFDGSIESYTTDSVGSIFKPLVGRKIDDRGSFNLELSKVGYFTKTVTYNALFDKEGVYEVHKSLDLTLDPEVKDLTQLVELNPINFDLGKHNIRTDAALELDKIVLILNKYPNMVVELGAHTDCRGSIRSNKSLSGRRAVSSARYIKERITNPDRISGRGYGESNLLNDCSCEGRTKSSCDEERHAVNRRTEFTVISTGAENVKVKE